MRLLPLLLLAGCPLTEKPDDDSAAPAADPLDLVLVVDASDSMRSDAIGLSANMDTLATGLDDAGVDWRIAITTNSVYTDNGPTAGVDPGEAGTFVGGAFYEDAEEVRSAILCGATCFGDEVPSDPSYTCGDPEPSVVSEEYLDCLCGTETWRDHCGSGIEEGLEASAAVLCRSVHDPSADCFGDALAESDAHTNPGFREGARVEMLHITDEGDSSRRLGAPGDTDVTAYVDLLDAMGGATLSMFGPAWDGSDGSCLDSAQSWGVERYQAAVAATGGTYLALTAAPGCDPVPFEDLVDGVLPELIE